jgi:hypothetical protein
MKRKLQKSKLAMIFKFIGKYLKDTSIEYENEKLRELNSKLEDALEFWKNECLKKDSKIFKLERESDK